MLRTIGCDSLDDLVARAVPPSILLGRELAVDAASKALSRLRLYAHTTTPMNPAKAATVVALASQV